MLPDYETCIARIKSYISDNYTSKGRNFPEARPGQVGFSCFWSYKTSIESNGGSIFSDDNISETASKLRNFLIYWSMKRTGIAEVGKMKNILGSIRSDYEKICNITLGGGEIRQFREQLVSVYDKLRGITNNVDYTGSESSITGKSKALVAIWGQTPGFDSINIKNFAKWTHPPAPFVLTPLRANKRYYEPSEFCDMILELDEWVSKWPESNNGRAFSQSFSDLCPNTPTGRLIDMIYNQKPEATRQSIP